MIESTARDVGGRRGRKRAPTHMPYNRQRDRYTWGTTIRKTNNKSKWEREAYTRVRKERQKRRRKKQPTKQKRKQQHTTLNNEEKKKSAHTHTHTRHRGGVCCGAQFILCVARVAVVFFLSFIDSDAQRPTMPTSHDKIAFVGIAIEYESIIGSFRNIYYIQFDGRYFWGRPPKNPSKVFQNDHWNLNESKLTMNQAEITARWSLDPSATRNQAKACTPRSLVFVSMN